MCIYVLMYMYIHVPAYARMHAGMNVDVYAWMSDVCTYAGMYVCAYS